MDQTTELARDIYARVVAQLMLNGRATPLIAPQYVEIAFSMAEAFTDEVSKRETKDAI